ncbi:MAG TPA: hypothetical protein VHA12_02110 [Candidatus Nanoarchaeia archaeon]|nr:hypothetical protein [Candidatus Nanoarchaeia archaeon]
MKKQVLGVLFFALVLVSMSFVSAAAADNVREFFTSVSDIIKAVAEGLAPLANLLFGSENIGVGANTPAFTVANIFIFIIVFVIVYIVVDSMEFFSAHTFFSWVISIAVSVLAVRFLSDGMINAIIFPYRALGIALAAGLPFVLYFVAVETKMTSEFGRKAAWIFLGVIYVFLYFVRMYYAPAGSQDLSAFSWIYLVTAAVCLLMVIFDGTLSQLRVKWAAARIGKDSKDDAIVELKKKLADIPNLVTQGIYTQAEAAKKKKQYIEKIAWFESH